MSEEMLREKLLVWFCPWEAGWDMICCLLRRFSGGHVFLERCVDDACSEVGKRLSYCLVEGWER